MSAIKLYTYSSSKKQYFYMKQKVRDTQTGKEGIIYKISTNISKLPIIEVSFTNLRKGYPLNQQIYLENI